MTTNITAGFWRRFIALIYDALIVIAILFFGSAMATVFVVSVWGQQSMEGGVSDGNWLFLVPSLLLWFGYYAFSWKKGGQTLGMKPWKLYVVDEQGNNISLKQSALRFASGLLGLGLLMIPILPGKLALQDWVSSSRTIVKK